MVSLNKIVRAVTHEGAHGKHFTPEFALKRALMNCLLWEDQFYEDGVAIADRIKALVPAVAPARTAQLAVEAREVMKLRHAPLLVLREMARSEKHRPLVADTLARIIQRPDEMTEFLAIYWADALGPQQQRKRQRLGADQEEPGPRAHQVRRLSAREIRSRRRRADQGRAVPGPRQAGGCRAGEGLETARRWRAANARHLGGLAVRWQEQARDL